MVTAIGSMDDISIHSMQRTILREQHAEVLLLPHMLKITKTDFGLSLGLPGTFWDGSYENGTQKMIRIRDVIHKGAWKKHLLRPTERNLPPGFTVVHFSLTAIATDFTRFFLKYYSRRYQALPDASRWILYNGARACAIWESWSEKIRLQQQEMQGFACPWIYKRIIDGRQLFDEYPQEIIKINRAAKAYRNSKGKFGYSPEVAYDRKRDAYTLFNAQVEQIAALAPPEILTPLPPNVPRFLLLEEPPLDIFAEGA